MDSNKVITCLSKNLTWTVQETLFVLIRFYEVLCQQLEDNKQIHIPPLGFLVVQKTDEHIEKDLKTNKVFLHPPKLILTLVSEQEMQSIGTSAEKDESMVCKFEEQAALLSKECERSVEDCSIFICELLHIVASDLNENQRILLPNFGTFKRFSVDSQTKTTFEAVTKVAKRINKPFYLFGIVELTDIDKDETPPEQTQSIEAEKEEEPKETLVPLVEQTPIVEAEQIATPIEESVPSPQKEDDELPPPPLQGEQILLFKSKKNKEKKGRNKLALIIIILIAIIIIPYFIITSLINKEKNDSASIPKIEHSNEKERDTLSQLKAETEPKTPNITHQSQEKDETNYPTEGNESENVIATIKVKKGDKLSDYALKYYGNEAFWVYIYDYNKARIKGIYALYVGIDIRIPAKHLYNIDKDSKQSISKAEWAERKLFE